MAGNNKNVGRPRIEDPKIKVPSYSLRQSTILEIEKVAEDLDTSKSDILQIIIDSGLEIVKKILK